MKKLLLAGSSLLLLSAAAFAANIPLLSGPYDPGNALGTLNAMIQSLNVSLSGVASSMAAAVTTGGATIETDASYTIPGNYIATGQGFRITAYGSNSSDANAKTLTFSFGGSTCALTMTGSGNTWQATFTVTETGSKTQMSECHGTTATTVVASVQATNWTVDNTAPIAVLVRQTAATSGTMTLNQAVMEYMR